MYTNINLCDLGAFIVVTCLLPLLVTRSRHSGALKTVSKKSS